MIIKNPARLLRKLSLSALSLVMLAGTAATPVLAENWTLNGNNLYPTVLGNNVGIGITNPAGKLDINGTSITAYGAGYEGRISGGTYGGVGLSGFYPFKTAVGANDTVVRYAGGNNYFVLQHGTANVLTADGSDNIGIGTTNPTAKLDVVGSARFIGYGSGDIWLPWTDGNSYFRSPINNFTSTIRGEGGNWSISSAGSPNFNGTSYLWGNVGVGIAPATKFHVKADTADQTYGAAPRIQAQAITGGYLNMVNLNLYTNNAGINMTSGLAFSMLDNASQMTEYGRIRSIIVDETNGSEDGALGFMLPYNGTTYERVRIKSDGSVGIGNSAPAQKLEVTGRIRMTTWTADGTTAVYKNSSGDIGLQSSDLRLKTNITPISDSLTKIAGINGVLFNWKTESDDAKKTVGVIAQDVMKVLPEATYTYKNENGEELYGVHYEKLTALLIQGMKEQQKKIDSLEQRLEILEKKIGN